ncbi:restriction endonuclease subunit S [Streptomyces noursei]|uniref:restriction endonuclease subunit S n=1 Tax=Streptomyces noursei TaxID=1971 RepID=UPI0036CB5760
MSAWSTIPIGDVVRVIGGGTPTRNNPDFYNGDIPWVTPKDMKRWKISDSQVRITKLGLESSAAKLAPSNSVLIVVRSGVLKHTVPVAVNRCPVAINQDMKALICSEKVDPSYLAYFIKERSGTILQWVRATTADNFPVSELMNLRIPLPPVGEQRRIAQILDHVEALRAERREALVVLDDLARSIFLDMFGDPLENPKGWPRLPLSEILLRIESGKSPQCLDRPAEKLEWGVLKLGAVTKCVYEPAENKALPDEITPDRRHEVRKGDLLFSRKNTAALVAAVAYVRSTQPHLLLPDLIFRLVPKDHAPIDKVYLHALFTYPSKRRKVQELASGSAASMLNISKAKLLGFKCEVPPLELQQEFSRRLDALENLKSTHRSHLAELNALFAALRHRAFNGELSQGDPGFAT